MFGPACCPRQWIRSSEIDASFSSTFQQSSHGHPQLSNVRLAAFYCIVLAQTGTLNTTTKRKHSNQTGTLTLTCFALHAAVKVAGEQLYIEDFSIQHIKSYMNILNGMLMSVSYINCRTPNTAAVITKPMSPKKPHIPLRRLRGSPV